MRTPKRLERSLGTGRSIVPVFTLLLSLAGLTMAAGRPPASASSDVEKLLKSARRAEMPGGKPRGRPSDAVRVATTNDGYLRTLVALPGQHFPVPSAIRGNPAAIAQSFLAEHRAAFGISHRTLELLCKTVNTRAQRSHVLLAQSFAGIPVFAAETIVQLNREGGVEYVSSDVMTDGQAQEFANAWLAPVITEIEAADMAIATLERENPALQFRAEPATLMIYQPSVVGDTGPARLVWHTEVTSTPDGGVAERVLVDALRGNVVLRVSLVHPSLYRVVYDCHNSDSCLRHRTEGMGISGVTDVDKVYDHLGDAYRFYRDFHGRDSIDNAGMVLEAMLRACYAGERCPWPNAQWVGSPYNYFVFGAGFVADDAVAHEFTHAVTAYESGLLYLNESGAINESFSDMWGEWVDQTNGRGNDSNDVKWLIGEDLPSGAGRNMKDPSAYPYNDPDRKGSANWHRLPPGVTPDRNNDFGYLHSNCGVNNKLCYLLTEGTGDEAFNGYRITGMGIPKVAALYYEVQTRPLLTPGADYDDLYHALVQAARNLPDWTAADQENLENACRAVEIAETSPAHGTSVEAGAEP